MKVSLCKSCERPMWDLSLTERTNSRMYCRECMVIRKREAVRNSQKRRRMKNGSK